MILKLAYFINWTIVVVRKATLALYFINNIIYSRNFPVNPLSLFIHSLYAIIISPIESHSKQKQSSHAFPYLKNKD